MDGCETKDDLDRCLLWDLLFKHGRPMTTARLKVSAADDNKTLSLLRIKSLTNHDWFDNSDGDVFIAYSNGWKSITT